MIIGRGSGIGFAIPSEIAQRGYDPEELLVALAPCFDAPPYRVEGVHFFSFNQIESTEKWRAEMLHRLRGGKEPGR